MNQSLKIIEASQENLKVNSKEKLKVCAYCRVSTDENDQKNSLKSQQSFFAEIFSRHQNWINVGIFADEGISGTSLEKRNEFIKMINKAMRGEIDIIFTKEVSRFSRNVLDLLQNIEQLRRVGVYVCFLTDDINTQQSNYRERLTQIAVNAEQESLRTSRRVKWGQQQQMQRGTVFGKKRMFAYNITTDSMGNSDFQIIEAEAVTVKKIFEWFTAGESIYTIARALNQQGINTGYYKNGWNSTAILRILQNEKYVGDLSQGKTYTPNPLEHKKKYNTGQAPMYYITNHHSEAAIIDRATWNEAQKLLIKKENGLKYSGGYWASGKIFCGICGNRYTVLTKIQKNSTYKAWNCIINHKNGRKKVVNGAVLGCDNKRVNDKVLRALMYDILIELMKSDEKLVKKFASFSDVERLYERITEQIKVFPENIIEIKLAFLSEIIKLKYTSYGKGASFKTDFTVI